MYDDRISSVLKIALKARDGRTQWMTLWQELAEMFCPNRADFLTKAVEGDDRHGDLYETTPELSARALRSAVAAMLRPPGKKWFKAKAKRHDLNMLESVRNWLHAVTEITYDSLYDPRVNAEKVLSEVDNDLVIFGTGIANVGWDKGKQHLVLRSKSLANTSLLAGKDGAPNASFEFTRPTLRQIVDEFGEDKLTEKMRDAYEQPEPKLDLEFEILHAILPNKDYKAIGGKAGRFPYLSLWISVECKELIDEKGFYDFPDVCPRWDTLTGEVYGRSSAMVALADGRVVQAMSKTFLEAGEFALRPPTWSYADMVQGELQMFPGGHTTVDMSGFQGTGAPIQSVQIGAFPDKIFEVYQRKNEAIAQAFFRDIMELPSARDSDMTATEINARLDQFLRQAAPIFNRVEHTYNAPLINRVFNVLMREGMYPEPPEEMHDQEVEFEYESPLKAAREKAEALKIVEGLGMLLPLAEAQAKLSGGAKADMLDNIDFDAVARLVGIKVDLPQAIFVPIETMMKMRDERAKQMAQMQKAEMLSKVGPAMARIGDTAVKAHEGGMLGAPAEIPSPALIPGMDEAEGDIMEGIYEEVA